MNDLPRGYIVKADDNCIGKKRTLITGCGTLHCEAFFDPTTGDLLETYFSKGSSGGCLNTLTGLSRMISLACRGGVDIYSIVDQLKSSGVCPSYAVRRATKHDTSKGSCCPVAIGNALIDMYEELQNELGLVEEKEVTEAEKKDRKYMASPNVLSVANHLYLKADVIFVKVVDGVNAIKREANMKQLKLSNKCSHDALIDFGFKKYGMNYKLFIPLYKYKDEPVIEAEFLVSCIDNYIGYDVLDVCNKTLYTAYYDQEYSGTRKSCVLNYVEDNLMKILKEMVSKDIIEERCLENG